MCYWGLSIRKNKDANIYVDLQKAGNLSKTEPYVNKVGYSERTDEVIEPKLSLQWFLKMKEIAQPALSRKCYIIILIKPFSIRGTSKLIRKPTCLPVSLK